MNIPNFDQWLGDWAMERERFLTCYQSLIGLDLKVHLQTGPDRAAEAAREQSQPNTLSVRTGDQASNIEVVALHGILMKSVPSGEQGTSTVLARRRIRAAAADSNIAGIMLHISSPGGTVDGTEAIAADIAAAAQRKPVYAYIDDMGASAAYWLASQANKVFANGTALVGSIGTYCVVYDLSGKAAQQGIKVHVVRAGEMKGQGEPGTEISAELLTELQARVDARNDFFVRGVAAGRKFSPDKIKSLADGRVHIAAAALAQGLIDGVQSFETTMSQLAAATVRVRPPTHQGSAMDTNMNAAVLATAQSIDATVATGGTSAATGAAAAAGTSGQSAAPAAAATRPATLIELKAACPGADSNFLVSQLEAQATVATAQTAFVLQLQQDKQSLAKQLSEKQTTAQATAKKVGVDPIPVGDERSEDASGDAVTDFNAAVDQLVTKGQARTDAIDRVAHRQPELYRNYLLATNANSKIATRQLREKFNV